MESGIVCNLLTHIALDLGHGLCLDKGPACSSGGFVLLLLRCKSAPCLDFVSLVDCGKKSKIVSRLSFGHCCHRVKSHCRRPSSSDRDAVADDDVGTRPLSDGHYVHKKHCLPDNKRGTIPPSLDVKNPSPFMPFPENR